MSSNDQDPTVHDLVGVGFGPSNLGLAIALHERRAQGTAPQLSAVFLEKQDTFGWHQGMLIEDATMQVSFLKDLVTTRNPSSDFSFLSFLQHVDRLHDFINHKTLFPLRQEFHDYMSWCAGRVQDQVRYGQEVVEVLPVHSGERVTHLDVVSRDAAGERTVLRARNVVFGPGLRPRMPEGVEQSARIWHNEYLLTRLNELSPKDDPRSFVVVGAGQSAAEAADHLHQRFPRAQVHAVLSRYGYSPSDDSPFANRIFDPEAVDAFHSAPEDVKRKLMGYHGNTNYSVVDPDLIGELYRRHYMEKVHGNQRLHLHNTSRVAGLTESPEGVAVVVEDLVTGKQTPLPAHYVVFATGYDPADARPLLGGLAESLATARDGRPAVDRDYRVVTDDTLTCGLYLQGGTEHTHGVSASLLSNIATRVAEIVDSVATRTADR
ncbi:lysine N(6)-hydroxylase/L-ornithine N(5)-oxygenase family protein [Nocardiopsis sp. HNM0947]|uniref:L-lysine N6-monooxygenase MbtG n=1 Tax=Nocardiopsis coralli TaxID=2772213 RepID=A0ABR9P194_9ACTN|nr:lysine N(6)-hydroxylase/L-ornithine N(5)-oxygenase family protein [Nocardiopsis coralli]MBE2997583.1 lysine N(6)-hydroxylase/L-ornithine N(5)-oxygenase family protein [Nocardiopsis coralli]